MLLSVKNHRVRTAPWTGALSWWSSHALFHHWSGCFLAHSPGFQIIGVNPGFVNHNDIWKKAGVISSIQSFLVLNWTLVDQSVLHYQSKFCCLKPGKPLNCLGTTHSLFPKICLQHLITFCSNFPQLLRCSWESTISIIAEKTLHLLIKASVASHTMRTEGWLSVH
jgi:hypothetical protein